MPIVYVIMDLIVEPDIYSPSTDEFGNYVDKIPSFNILSNGLRCACGARKDKVYDKPATFAAHIKTKCHLNWLTNMNCNRVNYYVEVQKLREIVHYQRAIISKLEKDKELKIKTIELLTQQLCKNVSESGSSELLDMD